MKSLCFITEKPVYTKIVTEKFPNRYGDYLVSLLAKADIPDGIAVALNTQENSLKNLDFKVIITLGQKPTGVLLQLPKTFKFGKYLGNRINNIIPWYSLEHLFMRGKELEDKTITLLRSVKNELEVLEESGSGNTARE